MTRTGIIALLWLVLAAGVWNALFDLYVSRGAREYLQLVAEHELGRGARPAMDDVMARASRAGAAAASTWAALIVAGGWGTLWLATKRD